MSSDWIIWKKNSPAGSHFGGIWECQIRSARAVLESLLRTHESSLNDEALSTLMIVIVNSRPLAIETIADGTSEAAISPSNLLTMKLKVVMRTGGVLDHLEHQIPTVEGDGEEFNTLQINFGADGGRNSLLHFKQDQNDPNQDII